MTLQTYCIMNTEQTRKNIFTYDNVFIVADAKETILDFLQRTVKVL